MKYVAAAAVVISKNIFAANFIVRPPLSRLLVATFVSITMSPTGFSMVVAFRYGGIDSRGVLSIFIGRT